MYRSKIAIGRNNSEKNSDCINCAKCMQGCDSNLIFNSLVLLNKLKNNTNFNYINNHKMTHFKESNDLVEVYFEKNDGEKISYSHKKCFIATGVIDTAIILNKSLGINNFIVKDSAKYYYPIFTLSKSKETGHNNLSNLTINQKLNNKYLHTQIYPAISILFLKSKLKFIYNIFLGRLMIGMTYLHSDFSNIFKIQINNNVINITGTNKRKSYIIFYKHIINLYRNSLSLGMFPIPIFFKSPIGHSQHFGGSIPMSKNCSDKTADELGRLSGMSNVHVIDASILSSIPATPTTILTSANAIRIINDIYKK
jgi:hypothetical protein